MAIKKYTISAEEIKELFEDKCRIEPSAYTAPVDGAEDKRYMSIETYTESSAPAVEPITSVGLYTFTDKQKKALRDMLAYLVEHECKTPDGQLITKTHYALLAKSSFNTNQERSDLYSYWSQIYYNNLKPNEIQLKLLANKCCCNAVLDTNMFSGCDFAEATAKVMAIKDMATYQRVDKFVSRLYSKWLAEEAITGEYKNKLFAAYKNATNENMPLELWGSMNRKYYSEYMKTYSKERRILAEEERNEKLQQEKYTEAIREYSDREKKEYNSEMNLAEIQNEFISELSSYINSQYVHMYEINENIDWDVFKLICLDIISKIFKTYELKIELNKIILDNMEIWNSEDITAELIKAVWS